MFLREPVTRQKLYVYAERNHLAPSMKIRRGVGRSSSVIPGHEDLVQDRVRTDQGYFPRRGAVQSCYTQSFHIGQISLLELNVNSEN